MKTKTILTVTFVFCVFGAGVGRSFAAEAAQPNILFILTDDQGWPTLGSYGGEIVPTPNLDRLAAEGARFTAAYVTPICTPTRATLLSGHYTARTGMFHVIINPWYGSPWAPMEELPFVDHYPPRRLHDRQGAEGGRICHRHRGQMAPDLWARRRIHGTESRIRPPLWLRLRGTRHFTRPIPGRRRPRSQDADRSSHRVYYE